MWEPAPPNSAFSIIKSEDRISRNSKEEPQTPHPELDIRAEFQSGECIFAT